MIKKQHSLLDELEMIVKRGASEELLERMPVILRLANATDSLTPGEDGMKFLKEEAGIFGPIDFFGMHISPEKAAAAAEILLDLRETGWDVMTRRIQAMEQLDLAWKYTEQWWRKGSPHKPSPQRRFLRLLAQQLETV